eukprot:6202878-Pleurochrysis_carterae.AAC.2
MRHVIRKAIALVDSDLRQFGLNCPDLARSVPIRADLSQSGQIWADLGRSGPIWADLNYLGRSKPIWPVLGRSGASRLPAEGADGERRGGRREPRGPDELHVPVHHHGARVRADKQVVLWRPRLCSARGCFRSQSARA